MGKQGRKRQSGLPRTQPGAGDIESSDLPRARACPHPWGSKWGHQGEDEGHLADLRGRGPGLGLDPRVQEDRELPNLSP